LSAYYHDAAAALLKDGEIVAAAQEERFTRKKGDPSFPKNAVEFCLSSQGISIDDVAHVVYYEKPWIHFERLLETYLSFAPKGLISFLRAMPAWLKQKLFIRKMIQQALGWDRTVLFCDHHESHMGAAFYPSPFEESAILTVDGVGEWATASWGKGSGNEIELGGEIHFPHSVGLLYSAVTYYLGFKVNFGEYKVMGLAPYGEPKYVDVMYDKLVDLRDDGSFRLNMDYFNYAHGLTMTNERFGELFGGPRRDPETDLDQRHMDVARSVQQVTEDIMLKMANYAHEQTGSKNLVLGGGVALNCVANGRILREGPFDNLWIQPAAGDSGSALGCALVAWHRYLGNGRTSDSAGDSQSGSYLGPDFSEEEIRGYLEEKAAPYVELTDAELPEKVATLIDEEKVVGFFHGKMEYGPRALGGRSIIGDARSSDMQTTMNLKIKYRESFRPFAPTVLRERVGDYFDHDSESPYMLIVAPVREDRCKAVSEEQQQLFGLEKLKIPRSDVPAITHVDYSARIQTVDGAHNRRYYDVLKAFEGKTGCGTIINTSFNVRGEPIVCTPDDAYKCFMRTEMDYLVLENFLLEKGAQPELQEEGDWRDTFELD